VRGDLDRHLALEHRVAQHESDADRERSAREQRAFDDPARPHRGREVVVAIRIFGRAELVVDRLDGEQGVRAAGEPDDRTGAHHVQRDAARRRWWRRRWVERDPDRLRIARGDDDRLLLGREARRADLDDVLAGCEVKETRREPLVGREARDRDRGVGRGRRDDDRDRRDLHARELVGEQLLGIAEPVGQAVERRRAPPALGEEHLGLRPHLAAQVREADHARVAGVRRALVGGLEHHDRQRVVARLGGLLALRDELVRTVVGARRSGEQHDERDRDAPHNGFPTM